MHVCKDIFNQWWRFFLIGVLSWYANHPISRQVCCAFRKGSEELFLQADRPPASGSIGYSAFLLAACMHGFLLVEEKRIVFYGPNRLIGFQMLVLFAWDLLLSILIRRLFLVKEWTRCLNYLLLITLGSVFSKQLRRWLAGVSPIGFDWGPYVPCISLFGKAKEHYEKIIESYRHMHPSPSTKRLKVVYKKMEKIYIAWQKEKTTSISFKKKQKAQSKLPYYKTVLLKDLDHLVDAYELPKTTYLTEAGRSNLYHDLLGLRYGLLNDADRVYWAARFFVQRLLLYKIGIYVLRFDKSQPTWWLSVVLFFMKIDLFDPIFWNRTHVVQGKSRLHHLLFVALFVGLSIGVTQAAFSFAHSCWVGLAGWRRGSRSVGWLTATIGAHRLLFVFYEKSYKLNEEPFHLHLFLFNYLVSLLFFVCMQAVCRKIGGAPFNTEGLFSVYFLKNK